VPLSNLPTGTVSAGEPRGTRPRDGDNTHADRSTSASTDAPTPSRAREPASSDPDADRDLYVAELEHENAALRAELDRRADREQQLRAQYERAVTAHDHASEGTEPAVSDDSLRLRVARLLGLR
jgi:hypothetical protein